jgi:uncharacterized protein (DUF58 family)
VYPAVKPTERFFEILPLLTGEIEAYQRGTGHDLYAIRDMLGTDSVRHVDWKASARAGTMMVREFAREDDRRVQLVLDARLGRAPLPEQLDQFEAAVEFCASLAWHFHEIGAQFQFVCGEFRTRVAPAGEIIYDILEFLALVRPDETSPDGPVAMGEDSGAFRILCTSMPRQLLQRNQPAQTHVVFFDTLPQT